MTDLAFYTSLMSHVISTVSHPRIDNGYGNPIIRNLIPYVIAKSISLVASLAPCVWSAAFHSVLASRSVFMRNLLFL